MDLFAHMHTFVRVVEAGSLSAAAKQLGVSTAAASRHVATLEAEVGTTLLARTTRRMSVTEKGQAYYERCLRVLREVDDAQAIGRAERGMLRLSLPVSIGGIAGASLVAALSGRMPETRLDVRFEDRVVDLVLDDVDLAVRVHGKPPLSTEIVARPLSQWSRVVVASPSWVRRHGEPSSPATLARYGALSTTPDPRGESLVLVDGDRRARVTLDVRTSCNDGRVIHSLVLDGRGVAVLPAWFVRADVSAKRLRRLLPGWQTEPVVVHALYRAAHRNERRVRALVEHLREVYSELERNWGR